MNKIEAITVRDKAVEYGCFSRIAQRGDGSWRVYLCKGERWTYIVDMGDLEEALAAPELWLAGDF